MFKIFLEWFYQFFNIVQEDKVFILTKGMKGIDISHWNEKIDFNIVQKHVDFIYMKSTEGRSFISKTYQERAKILNELKIPWGAYHYFRINVDPIVQAKNFLKYYDNTNALPPVIDVEKIHNGFYNSNHTENVLIMLKEIEKATGVIPIVYTNFFFARDKMQPSKEFEKYPLWLAWYTRDINRVQIPKPWNKMKIWQCTNKGEVPGVEGRVDINIVQS